MGGAVAELLCPHGFGLGTALGQCRSLVAGGAITEILVEYFVGDGSVVANCRYTATCVGLLRVTRGMVFRNVVVVVGAHDCLYVVGSSGGSVVGFASFVFEMVVVAWRLNSVVVMVGTMVQWL